MLRHSTLGLGLLALAALFQCTIAAAPACAQDATASPVRIGMVGSLFTDVNPVVVRLGSVMFATLMKSSTGMDGQMVPGGEALAVAKNLHDGKLDLAVFHGVEFAWAQERYPDLKPLMIAVTKYPHTQACLVVSKEGPITHFADLKGKVFALPLFSREHCRLFLHRHLREHGGHSEPHKFFGSVVRPNYSSALDDVSTGKIDAVVVDVVSLEKYAEVNPGRFTRLRVLTPSEHFPTGVIAYREGALKDDVLNKFRTGLLEANKSDLARELFESFKITSFETVPASYAQMLSEIIKIYPAPAAQ